MNVLDDLSLLGLFLFSIWVVGLAFEPLKSAMVGELAAGMALGSYALDLIRHESAIFIVGQFGLCMLVLEGGLSVEGQKIKLVGRKAFLVSLGGSLFSLLFGLLILLAFGNSFKTALVGGLCASPTSIGIATRLLRDAGYLDTEMGGIICVAAMMDDVMGLIILAIISKLSALDGSDTPAWLIITQPIVASLGSLLVGWLLTSKIVPAAVSRLRQSMETSSSENPTLLARILGELGISFSDALLAMLMTSALALTVASGYAGTTFLLGTFVAGVSFASIKELDEIWEKNCTVVVKWVSGIFFASIGALVPLSDLFSMAILTGLCFTIGAILGKWLPAAFMCFGWQPAGGSKGFPGRWRDWNTVGWAMVGRGELGLVMAAEARRDGLMDDKVFAVVIWGLLLSTMLSPLVFRYHLRARIAADTETHESA